MSAKPNHTPGEWKPCRIVADGEALNLYAVTAAGKPVAVGILRPVDARLIAKAPRMLEAGRDLAMRSLQSTRYQTDPEFRDSVDALLATICEVLVTETPEGEGSDA